MIIFHCVRSYYDSCLLLSLEPLLILLYGHVLYFCTWYVFCFVCGQPMCCGDVSGMLERSQQVDPGLENMIGTIHVAATKSGRYVFWFVTIWRVGLSPPAA